MTKQRLSEFQLKHILNVAEMKNYLTMSAHDMRLLVEEVIEARAIARHEMLHELFQPADVSNRTDGDTIDLRQVMDKPLDKPSDHEVLCERMAKLEDRVSSLVADRKRIDNNVEKAWMRINSLESKTTQLDASWARTQADNGRRLSAIEWKIT